MPSQAHRAWVRLPSGRRMDLNNPTFADIDDHDLALGLARTFRWGGHSRWPLPMSVAQHSLLVLQIRRNQSTLSPTAQLRELLHDAEEGLIGFDPISPLKPVLGAEFLALMDRMQKMVFARYGLAWWTAQDKARHKKADILAAASEAIHVAGWDAQEVQSVLGIEVAPLQNDPLQAVHGGTAWEPWPVDVCVERFLKELHSLLALRDQTAA
ncbi:phosphohydrolase [Curvibacter sp. APW13]|uniref:phosphohydrolase n=1 Tax=Curvibacter sp. APW13 TaxID=3077236 RepID=UPI0028DF6FD5|nr:phosphohydrolase [Curvibacter sp. APW13]MDT8992429.1 phosphohydrolase [Curvibacter sp. APW13]